MNVDYLKPLQVDDFEEILDPLGTKAPGYNASEF